MCSVPQIELSPKLVLVVMRPLVGDYRWKQLQRLSISAGLSFLCADSPTGMYKLHGCAGLPSILLGVGD